MDIIGAVKGLASKRSVHNDDLFVDRLNHKYTTSIIVVFALVITASQYSGKPINCWVPGHFTGNYGSYADDICWVSSTYNIPMNEDLPHSETDRKEKMLKYYQWTPFILLLMAMLFYLPRMIWRSLNDKSGLDVQSIVDAVYNQAADRQGLLGYLTNTFDHYVMSNKNPKDTNDMHYNFTEAVHKDTIQYRKRRHVYEDENQHLPMNDDTDEDEKKPQYQEPTPNSFKQRLMYCFKTCCVTKGKRTGNYLTVLFIITRVMYTLNSFLQLFMLNHFLGNDFLLLGFEVIAKVWVGDDWAQLKRFPRVTMCDFKIREVGITHRYTVQCVLSINLFNEKIFIFLWFWLCLVSFMNVFDLIGWIHSLIINSQDRYAYVKQRLYASNNSKRDQPLLIRNSDDKRLFKKFVNNYLKEDGVLALRLLSRNSQDLIVAEVVAKLFESYKENQAIMKEQRRMRKIVHNDNEYDETPRFAVPTPQNFSTINENPSATNFLNKHIESSH